MTGAVRYNKAIDLLEQGKPVFCSGLVWNGNLDDLMYVADSDYDMVIVEMEHEGLSFNNLRISLQFLLNRKKIAEGGGLAGRPGAPWCAYRPTRGSRTSGSSSRRWTPGCMDWYCLI